MLRGLCLKSPFLSLNQNTHTLQLNSDLILLSVRFKILPNNHLQIRGIKKTDEGSYTCEGRLMARGEIDLKIIRVIVNGQPTSSSRSIPLSLYSWF